MEHTTRYGCYVLLGILVVAEFIAPGCKDAGIEGPVGEFLFLEQFVVEQARVIEGDSAYIPIVTCADCLGQSYSYDFSSRTLTIYPINWRPDFDVEQMIALVGFTLEPSRYVRIGFRSPIPVQSFPHIVGGLEIRSVARDGAVMVALSGASYTVDDGDSLIAVPAVDTVRGFYTIPPDTTRLPFAIEMTRTRIVRNFGYWPKRNITFVVN